MSATHGDCWVGVSACGNKSAPWGSNEELTIFVADKLVKVGLLQIQTQGHQAKHDFAQIEYFVKVIGIYLTKARGVLFCGPLIRPLQEKGVGGKVGPDHEALLLI